MRRTRRNLIALLLTLAMILSLTACGSKKEDTSAPATESPSAEAPAETEADEASAEAASDENA